MTWLVSESVYEVLSKEASFYKLDNPSYTFNKYETLTDFSATKSKKTTAFLQVYLLAFSKREKSLPLAIKMIQTPWFLNGRRHGVKLRFYILRPS